jgi:hypothetical protein
MDRDLDFDAVMLRLRQALDLKDNKAVAAALRLKPNAFYNRRSSGSIPFENVVALAGERGLSCDWIFLGLGDAFRAPGRRRAPGPDVDAELLGEAAAALERAFRESPQSALARDPVDLAAMRAMLAAHLYNRALQAKPGAARSSTIRSEARSMAAAAELVARTGRRKERR